MFIQTCDALIPTNQLKNFISRGASNWCSTRNYLAVTLCDRYGITAVFVNLQEKKNGIETETQIQFLPVYQWLNRWLQPWLALFIPHGSHLISLTTRTYLTVLWWRNSHTFDLSFICKAKHSQENDFWIPQKGRGRGRQTGEARGWRPRVIWHW